MGNSDRAANSEDHPDCSSDQTKYQRFDEELQAYIFPGSTYRHPNTDFAGSLRNRNQHDVHDADTADQKTDRRNRRKVAAPATSIS